MNILFSILLVTFAQLSAQKVYYQNENGEVVDSENHAYNFKSVPAQSSPVELPINGVDDKYSDSVNTLIPKRGTQAYEKFVNHAISSGLMTFTLAVKKVITNQSRKQYDNIVFAPVSMAGSLALVLLGANGKTYQEISSLLGFATGVPDLDKKSQIVHEQFGRMILKLETTSGFVIGSQVNFASAIFIQDNYPIRKLYQETAEKIYQSEVLNLDFEKNPVHAQRSINAWVSDRTNGKIPEVLSDLPSANTKVIIASAMYFNAEWEHPFFDGATKRRPFYTNGVNNPSDVWVDMMSNGGNFPYYKDKVLDCEILGFPYKGNQTTMYVVKPINSSRDKLRSLENTLREEDLRRLVANVRETSVALLFPKMLIDSTVDLKSSLQYLGVSSLFNPAEANLALISPGPIDNIRDKVKIPSPSLPTNPYEDDDVLIFNRFGDSMNCTELFNMTKNATTCEQVITNTTHKVIYKKIDDKIGRRIVRQAMPTENLDNLRESINKQPNPQSYENPGLYANKVVHKVYMHITESGTEAAASTLFGLSKSGTRVVFRAEVPFFFFIMHEETKVISFWGSVNRPTPFYTSNTT
ncbi:hypothetical protein HHI36_011336 [Cryptolaemus montrouzieri]|uniref:Serpin domain-containing protein n=1 Tax=Cryptolaemus montrouzieri TaxID=559131 RepID=A0ABD2MLI6_9CUCU